MRPLSSAVKQVPKSPHPEVEGGLLFKELMGASELTDDNGIATFHLSFTSRGQVKHSGWYTMRVDALRRGLVALFCASTICSRLCRPSARSSPRYAQGGLYGIEFVCDGEYSKRTTTPLVINVNFWLFHSTPFPPCSWECSSLMLAAADRAREIRGGVH
jgi:hypothetical protein